MTRNPNSEPRTKSNIENDQKLPESTPEKIRRRAIMAGFAVALTLAASWGANRAAENKPREMPETITAELDSGTTIHEGLNFGLYDTIPDENLSLSLPGVEYTIGAKAPDTKSELFVSPESDIQLMEWARKFDVDPSAVEPRGPEAITGVVKQIEELQTEGWSIDKITVQGFASDEGDDREGDNPGFGLEVNEKNIKLADKRASAVNDLFLEEIEKTMGVSKASEIRDTIERLGGEEVRDDELEVKISSMAEKLEMPMDDMVMQFNRDPESLPIEAQELLGELYEDRFVRIEIEATKEIVIAGDQKTKSIIIIPIFIPIPRRKRTSPTPTTTPPVIIPKEEPVIKPVRQKFPHAPKNIGKVRPGYQSVAGYNKDPNTHNGGHSKGSGGSFAAKVHTTHRGNSARKH